MRIHIMKVLGGAAMAGALSTVCLIGAAGPAAASPAPAQQAHSSATPFPRVGFQPAASSFVSPTWGVVLGGAPSTAGNFSRVRLAMTSDGGMHWSSMPAPAVWLASPSGQSWLPQVSKVLFADRSNGWLYGGNTVWATHNGGMSWRPVTLPGTVRTMAAATTGVYAVVQRPGGDQLYRSPLGSNAWMRAGAWWWNGPMTGSVLAASGSSVWFASNTSVWTSTDGVHWARYALRSPGNYYGVPYTLAGISAASPRIVTFLWTAPSGMYRTGMKVQVSFNGGRTQWQTATSPPARGNVAGFAMSPGGYGVVAIAVVTPGADYVYRSADLGWHWTTAVLPGTGGGVMLNSLQMMSPTAGCLVAGLPTAGYPSRLLWTDNAARTWYPIPVRI